MSLIHALEELGHIQNPVPMKTDNSTAKGIINKTVNLKRSKAFDLHCWWLLDPNETIFKVIKAQVVTHLVPNDSLSLMTIFGVLH